LFQNILFQDNLTKPVSVTVLREDLNHPLYQGNKFWKLKNNLFDAIQNGHDTLLTFGGACSNHIYATAVAGSLNHLKTIGVIRGQEPAIYSSTLQFAREHGMRLHFVTREEYRRKEESGFIARLKNLFGDFHLIPEGGSNEAGLRGCVEWGDSLVSHADIFCLAAGTATTAAGIAQALLSRDPGAKVIAFSALKDGGFLKTQAEKMAGSPLPNLSMITDYHFGGYAKYTPELLAFITQIEKDYSLPLEHVYTGKTLYGILDLSRKSYFPGDKRICFIHTGGLQGKLHSKDHKELNR